MASNSTMIKKLQTAINMRGYKLLYSTSQFYSDKQDRPVTVYTLRNAYLDEQSGKHKTTELFKTTSQIQMVLYLRDFWYEINGIPIPQDNKQWNDIKQSYKEENNGSDRNNSQTDKKW